MKTILDSLEDKPFPPLLEKLQRHTYFEFGSIEDHFKYRDAVCHLDYTMSEAGGATEFVREYTLASGGPYCDCGYRRKRHD